MRTFKIKLRGISYYSQSKKYTEKVKPSDMQAYEEANWRKKLHVNSDGKVVLPGTGLKQAVESAARLAGDKVAGRGNKTWGSLFISGIMVTEDFVLNVDADTVVGETYSCDSQGNRGDYSSKRVDRVFPMIPPGWEATGEIHIINPDIKAEKLEEYLRNAGAMIGVGRFRPSKGGHNGRFHVVEFVEVKP